MDSPEAATCLYILFGSLLIAPPAALLLYFLMRRRWPRIRYVLFVASLLILASSFVFALSGLSFTAILANFSYFALAYFSYSFLAASCFQISRKVIRIIALAVAVMPIGIGYFLATPPGMIGLVLFSEDFTQAPYKTERMNDQLICRVRGWGSVATDSGYEVDLYRVWPLLPFLQRRVARISVSETSPDPAQKGATCADVLALYEAK